MLLQTKLQNTIIFIYALFSLLSFSILISCGDNRESAETVPATVNPESFTFFELGTNTKLTDHVRKDLGKKIGRDAIERRSTLDLDTNYEGFIKKHLPKINELNRKLNFPPGERVEHNTVKLMYRYASKKNVPFDYVELVFSNYTKIPLLFKINFREDEAGIIKTLESKYGQPQIVDWQEENGKSMYWMKNADFLIASQVPDQFGHPKYQIVIYFVKNLEQLISTEKNKRQEKTLERIQSGEKAF